MPIERRLTGLASPCGPDHLAIRRNVSIAVSEAEAQERSQMASEAAAKVLAGGPRVLQQSSSLLDAPKHGSGFSVHADEFIAGTPAQVAEQIVAQCRASGAGHFLAILGRAVSTNTEFERWSCSLSR
jgi:alkanesulfonate monooxygenase SsuD/methylene tetrahydromethanopterin reductase-like flavin-dependent oxidoreductase (luciferase family)